MVDRADALQFRLRQHRRGQLQHGAVVGIMGQQVSVVADVDGAVRLAGLPQRVDGRVGHLSEALFEVIEQRRVGLRQGGNGLVRAHGYDGLLSRFGHRQYDVLDVLPGIAEGLAEGFRIVKLFIYIGFGKVAQPDDPFDPLPIGVFFSKVRFQCL